MKIQLCTLVLNEIEWLEKNYNQHKNWPNLDYWVFVESADVVYAQTNPGMVTSEGLSTDGTSTFLQELENRDERVVYIPHGFCKHEDKAQGKCEARNRYLDVAEECKPDYIVQIDCDEFWPYESQKSIEEWLTSDIHKWSFSFQHREIWHPPALCDEPLFKYEISGGFWDILYCRAFKYIDGMTYRDNHNTPVTNRGQVLTEKIKDHRKYRLLNNHFKPPQYVHMGFACSVKNRVAKNEYYRQRGEMYDSKRSWYTESRAYFESWKPGEKLPKDVQVIEYKGPIPECFEETL
jgi:hypothetical protein